MDATDALKKIKNLLFGEQAPVVEEAPKEPVVAKMAMDYTLEDGTVVSVDELKVGGKVTVAGAPAPDAAHKLQDGTIVTTKDGVIVEIKEVEVEVEAKIDEEMKKKMATYDDQISAALISNKNLTDAVKQLFSLVEKMADQSIKTPTEKISVPYDQMTNFQKLKFNRGEL